LSAISSTALNTWTPDRVAVVDEPDQPAPGLGSLISREAARNARAQAARLDQPGLPVGGRVVFVSQNSAWLLTSFFGVSGDGRILVPIDFRLSRAEIACIVEHSGAASSTSIPKAIYNALDVPHKFLLGGGDLYLPEVEPRPRETPDEAATATIDYTSALSGSIIRPLARAS
jgi:acyl-CoA synthetase (AMP-forming)/AMP-acid ligase II